MSDVDSVDVDVISDGVVVAALYKFVRLDNFRDIQAPLLAQMKQFGVKGTLLLAEEGINGTIAGSRKGIDGVLAWLKQDSRLTDLLTKESLDSNMPFYRAKVKLKKEIVTMGVEGIDPKKLVGTYVKPHEWNQLISDPDVLLIDTRNDYEIGIGQFKNAVNPHTKTFREFPQYVAENLDTAKHKKVAMYCTGGIRCEKSTAFLKEQGFEEVYHLEGGILKYLEDVDKNESLWQGECFVFDNRVSVDHDLNKGRYDQCHACRLPVTEEEKLYEKYEAGVSCHRCYDDQTPEQRKRFQEREKQIILARKRGEEHLGSNLSEKILQRRQEKLAYKNKQRGND